MPAGCNTQFQRYTARPRALITDIEGILMDNDQRVTASAIVELYNRRGVTISVEQASGCRMTLDELGTANQTQLRNMLRHVVRTTSDTWAAAKGAPPTEWDLEAMFKEMPQAVADLMKIAPAHPAAVGVISGLVAQGIKIGAATEFDEEVTPAWVKHAQATGIQIDSSVSAAEAGIGGNRGAPPLPYRSITLATNLGVFPFDGAVRVTNTLWGVQEGMNAGMWTVGVSSDEAVRTDFAYLGAHYLIADVSELPAVIDEIGLRMRMGGKP
eukprot:TRINITY_DN11201_c0_g1_i1.p1 TRINITY_DN11201_c0_g1~~TRINITY_DN11201_c0_g1_i1.p1  ORF type:complete len:269 (+),score=62.72 TRINITY_DN11201_c0_g1_i1:246-1052(+)